MLIGIAGMSVVSILGRAVFGKPVDGDFELVQLGCAVGVSAFLPWCQLRRSNITVDFFTSRLSPRLQAGLDAVGAVLLALVMALVAWRTAVAAVGMRATGETSMIVAYPLWTGYAAMVPSLGMTAVAGFYTAYQSLREFRRSATR